MRINFYLYQGVCVKGHTSTWCARHGEVQSNGIKTLSLFLSMELNYLLDPPELES